MKKIFTLLLIAFTFQYANAQITDTLTPVQDGHYFTFGGGEGANALLKFDISSIPLGWVINNATIQVYVFDTMNSNGNALFRNFNIQTWVESDSAAKFDPGFNPAIVYSDSTSQLAGFGDSIGWASSVDLKAILNTDYAIANTFCTFLIKDPDDMTCCGAVGPNFSAFLGDFPDTIPVGNATFGESMKFYPREYTTANLRPRLIVEYEPPLSSLATIKNNATELTVFPNPVSGNSMTIQLSNTNANGATLNVVNGLGQVVYTHNFTEQTPNYKHEIKTNTFEKGLYFITVQMDGSTITKKVWID